MLRNYIPYLVLDNHYVVHCAAMNFIFLGFPEKLAGGKIGWGKNRPVEKIRIENWLVEKSGWKICRWKKSASKIGWWKNQPVKSAGGKNLPRKLIGQIIGLENEPVERTGLGNWHGKSADGKNLLLKLDGGTNRSGKSTGRKNLPGLLQNRPVQEISRCKKIG